MRDSLLGSREPRGSEWGRGAGGLLERENDASLLGSKCKAKIPSLAFDSFHTLKKGCNVLRGNISVNNDRWERLYWSTFIYSFFSCLIMKTTSIEMRQTTFSVPRDTSLGWTHSLGKNLGSEDQGNLFTKKYLNHTLDPLDDTTTVLGSVQFVCRLYAHSWNGQFFIA